MTINLTWLWGWLKLDFHLLKANKGQWDFLKAATLNGPRKFLFELAAKSQLGRLNTQTKKKPCVLPRTRLWFIPAPDPFYDPRRRRISSRVGFVVKKKIQKKKKMPITIIAPKSIPRDFGRGDDEGASDSDSSGGGADVDGDVKMRPAKRVRRDDEYTIVTPGEVITDDPQWMRFVSRPPSPPLVALYALTNCHDQEATAPTRP